MQLVIRNNELFPVQVTFENDQVVGLGPDDVLTLRAGVGTSLVVEEDRIQIRGIASHETTVPDADAASSLTEPAAVTTDTPDQHDMARTDDSSRPDTLHTI